MAQAYATLCRNLINAGKLTGKTLLAYFRAGRLTNDEYETLLALLTEPQE